MNEAGLEQHQGVVDPCDLGTWPSEVTKVVEGIAATVREKPDHTLDLVLGEAAAQNLSAALGRRRLQVFHATRLLGHEVDQVREQGLRRLHRGLVSQRITSARDHGALTASQAEGLLASSVFEQPDPDAAAAGHREGRVCACIGRQVFDRAVRGVRPLLSHWGGEAIYWAHLDDDSGTSLRDILRRLGSPAVVALAVNPPIERQDKYYPDLVKVFVGTHLGLDDAQGNVHYFSDVPPDQILAVWRPGDAEYDLHAGLPRS